MSAHEPPIALLLIEDNAGDALMVQSALEYAAAGQHHIARATSLGAALATLGESRFDAILLDLSLPDSLGAATLDSVITWSKARPTGGRSPGPSATPSTGVGPRNSCASPRSVTGT